MPSVYLGFAWAPSIGRVGVSISLRGFRRGLFDFGLDHLKVQRSEIAIGVGSEDSVPDKGLVLGLKLDPLFMLIDKRSFFLD